MPRHKLYMSEIFPTRIRDGGVSVGAATQWLFNFTFSQITPHAITNLGWKTFVMFAIFNWALVAYTWFFIKEVRILFIIPWLSIKAATDKRCNRPRDGLLRKWSWCSTRTTP